MRVMKKTLFYLVTFVIILVIVVLTWQYQEQPSTSSKSVLILPFNTQSNDKENQYLIEGSIKEQNDSVEIQVQIIDSLTGDQIWSKMYKGSKNELQKINDKIEQEIKETMILLK